MPRARRTDPGLPDQPPALTTHLVENYREVGQTLLRDEGFEDFHEYDFRIEGEGDAAALVWDPLPPIAAPAGIPYLWAGTQTILGDFIRLAAHPDPAHAVLEFARRYGPLWLCDHQQYASHAPGCRPSLREPIRIWVSRAARVATMAGIARELHHQRVPDMKVWERLSVNAAINFHINTFSASDEYKLAVAWSLLASAVNGFVQAAEVQPSLVDRAGGPPTLTLGNRTAISAVATELLYHVLGNSQPFCDVCWQPYEPYRQRAPRKGHEAVCADCARRRRNEATRVRKVRMKARRG